MPIDKEFDPLWQAVQRWPKARAGGEPDLDLLAAVAATHDDSRPVDEVPEPVLAEWADLLGLPALAELLGGGGGPADLLPEEGQEILSLILDLCPPPRGALWDLLDEAAEVLLPRAMGTKRLDLRNPGPVYATRLPGAGAVSWRPFSGFAAAPRLLSPTGDEGLVGPAVRFEGGLIHVEAAAVPADGRWRLFCLVAPGLDPLEACLDEREVLALCRDPHPPVQGGAPAEHVLRGRLVDGWRAALEAGWDDPALRGLLLLLFAKMEMLMAEAARQVALADPGHQLLLGDLTEALPSERLAGFKQSLIDDLKR